MRDGEHVRIWGTECMYGYEGRSACTDMRDRVHVRIWGTECMYRYEGRSACTDMREGVHVRIWGTESMYGLEGRSACTDMRTECMPPRFVLAITPRAAVVHLNFRVGSTFPVPVCTVPSSMERASRGNKVDAVRLYASYRLNLLEVHVCFRPPQ